MIRFARERVFRHPLPALMGAPYEWRLPSRYIAFCQNNVSFWMERDRVSADRFDIVGCPSFDPILRDGSDGDEPIETRGRYYLLIDSPFLGAELAVALPDYLRYLATLNEFCMQQNARLLVKLHPTAYSTALLDHPNIVYLRDYPIRPLLKNALGCFGFTSTLMLVAPLFTPCVIVQPYTSAVVEDIIGAGLATRVDFHTFTAQDIQFVPHSSTESALVEWVDKYVGYRDGRATERIRQILTA
jgi:hypothetical protein